MKLKAYTLNSFAKTENGGNPAGVVPSADNLSEEEMQKTAALLGFSETAFVSKSDCADFKLRFFTPINEVDLCGHATIGTYYTLSALGIIKNGVYNQETKAGILRVEINEDLSVMMNQTIPEFYDILDKREIADSLNLTPEDFLDNVPVQIVSTGLKDIMVPVKSLKVLNSIIPDMNKIKDISKKCDVTGYHVFTLETLHNSTANCRNFAPLCGIPEESATGTSNGALGSYLYKYKLVNSTEAKNMVMEQGYVMDKPSEILVSLTTSGDDILEVKVGGKALNLKEIQIEI